MWHIKMQLSLFQCDSSRGVKKQGRLLHCLLYGAVLLTECVEQVS